MEYMPVIAVIISILALVVSGLSLWVSWGAQYHTKIVTYEQRRQQVQQILLEGQILAGQSSNECYRAISIAEDILVKEKISELLKCITLDGTQILRDGIVRHDAVRHEY